MNKSTLLLVTFSLTMGFIAQSEAIAVKIGSPKIIFTPQQPIQAVIVDSKGNASEQTFYYNPDIDGVDIDASMAGPKRAFISLLSEPATFGTTAIG